MELIALSKELHLNGVAHTIVLADAEAEQTEALRKINAMLVDIEADLKRYHMPKDPINGKHKVMGVILDDIVDARRFIVKLRDAKDPNDDVLVNVAGLLRAIHGNVKDLFNAAKNFLDKSGVKRVNAPLAELTKLVKEAKSNKVMEDDFYGTLASVLSAINYGIDQYYSGR